MPEASTSDISTIDARRAGRRYADGQPMILVDIWPDDFEAGKQAVRSILAQMLALSPHRRRTKEYRRLTDAALATYVARMAARQRSLIQHRLAVTEAK